MFQIENYTLFPEVSIFDDVLKIKRIWKCISIKLNLTVKMIPHLSMQEQGISFHRSTFYWDLKTSIQQTHHNLPN